MSTPLEDAIAQLEAELTDLKLGMKEQPKDGTAGWFTLRGKALGLSLLRSMKARSLEGDCTQADAFYKTCRREMKGVSDSG